MIVRPRSGRVARATVIAVAALLLVTGGCEDDVRPPNADPAAGAGDAAPGGGTDCASKPSGFVCRPPTRPCETPAVCDGASPACPPNGSLSVGAACTNGCGSGTCEVGGQCSLASFVAKGNACGGSSTAQCDGYGLCVPAALAPFVATTRLPPFELPTWENRVDIDGDGATDSYWTQTIDSVAHECRLVLHRLDGSTAWTATIADCAELARAPAFHTRSFMGSKARDFTQVVIRPASNVCVAGGDPLTHFVVAGDGETGQLRKLNQFLGNATRAGVIRQTGIEVVDFAIPSHPGPALMVRTTGDFYSHLYYFPTGTDGYVELTAPGGPASFGSPTPFPGVDLPNDNGTSSGYTHVYNTFNASAPCAPITESGTDKCGIPDVNACAGNGHFLGSLVIGDIDADGVDDAEETFFWRSVVYPGRPKGQAQFLGAPQYDFYYNPQSDGGGCHSGRHYGLVILAQVDDDAPLETIHVAGLAVDEFNDPFQNVSRNMAVIDTTGDVASGTTQRKLLWNRPLTTSIGPLDATSPRCNPNNKLYDNSLHFVGDGTIRASAGGKVQYLGVNRWTQQSEPATPCTRADPACPAQEQATQTGEWTWELVEPLTGKVALSRPFYVWDAVPNPDGGVWIVYSAEAKEWNLGTKVTDGVLELLKPSDQRVRERQLRPDLTVALLEPSSLTLSRTQTLPIVAKPWLRLGQWQSTSPAVTAALSKRLFTRIVEGKPELTVISDYALVRFAFDGERWVARPVDAP